MEEKCITQIISGDEKLYQLYITDPIFNKSIKHFLGMDLSTEEILIETIKVMADENKRLTDVSLYDLEHEVKPMFYSDWIQ